MKTLLIIQNDNNHFATICENLQQNDLEKFYTDYKNVFAQGNTKDFENFFKSFVFQIGATQSFMTQEDEIDRFFWELQKRNELDLILKYDESNGFLSFFIPANVDNNNLMIEYDMNDDYHILQTLNTKENNNEQHIDAGASRVGDIERERYSQEKTSGIERIGIDGERSREERLSGDEIQTLGEPSQRSIKNSETQTHNSDEERLGLSSLENSAIYMRGKAKTSNDRESSLFSTQEYDTKISQGDLAGKSQEASAGDNRPIYDMGRKNEQKVGVDAFTGKSKNFQSTNETYAQRVDLLLQSPKLASAVRKLLRGFTIQSEYSFIRQKFESNESGASANRADIGEQLQQESSLFDISGNDRWNQTILPNGRQIGRNRERSIERLGRGNETQLRGVDTAVIETLSTSKTNSGATTSISGDNASNLFGIQGMSSDDSNAIAEQEFAIKDDYEKEPNGDTNHQYAEVLPRETILGEWIQNSTNPRDNQLGVSSSQVAQQNEERGILGESNINRESSIGFGTDHRENEKNDVGTSTNRESFLDDMGGADNDLETSENKAQSNIDKEIEAEIAFVPNDKIKFNPEEWEIITLVPTSENKLKSVSTPMFEEKTSQDFSHTESTQAQSIETLFEENFTYLIKDLFNPNNTDSDYSNAVLKEAFSYYEISRETNQGLLSLYAYLDNLKNKQELDSTIFTNGIEVLREYICFRKAIKDLFHFIEFIENKNTESLSHHYAVLNDIYNTAKNHREIYDDFLRQYGYKISYSSLFNSKKYENIKDSLRDCLYELNRSFEIIDNIKEEFLQNNTIPKIPKEVSKACSKLLAIQEQLYKENNTNDNITNIIKALRQSVGEEHKEIANKILKANIEEIKEIAKEYMLNINNFVNDVSTEITKEILDEEIVEPNEEYKIKDSLEIQNKNNLVLEKIKTNQKLLFDDENNPYYFITNFEMTFYDKDTDQYDFKKRDVNKPRSEYLEILKRDYPEIASKELKYYSSVKTPTPSGLRMLSTERSSSDGKYIEITSIEMPMEQYEKIDKIFDSPQVSNDNKEENHNMENIPSPVDDIEIRKGILKLKESIANEQTFKDTLGNKQNLHILFEYIFKEKYLDLYLENKSFFTKLGDKQVEFKNNIKDRIFNEIMEEYEKSLTTKENISTNFEKEEPVRQNSTNDDLNFKTFSDYQFLQILDGEEYRGEIDFNLNKAQRIQANLEALRLTQEILSQNRLVATSQEQEILAKFSGFGGLSELFNNEKYEAQRAEFENILGQKLYREILYSSFNAYYTPKKIINAMYDGFASMGVPNNEKIRALEPSCGIGHFITLAPPNYEFEAVEKDTLTATIAKLLHPKTRIHNKGFEEISFDREFDVVIGNPPYENIRVNDDSGNNELIHNYFVLKSQKLLKEQGISNFVITSGFLDSKTDEHRIKLAQDNFLVNAFRLPNIAFNVTHTSVLSDIVFLQKVTDKQAFKNRLLKANNNDEYLTGLILKDLDNKTNLMKHTRLMDNDNGSIRFNNFFDYYYKRILGDRDIGTNQFGEYVMQVKDTGLFDDTIQRIDDFNVANISGLFNPIPAKESKLKSLLNLNLDNEKIEYLENLSIGNIFEHNGEFYTKEDNFTYSPVYFTDSIEKEKKYLINKDDIIVEFNQDGSEKKEKKNINYKNYPNETEKKILRLLIEFRDLLKDNIKNERNLPNDEQSNQLIMGQKEKLRAIRARILSLADSKGFAQKGQKNKKDKKSGLVSQHRLQDIIELEKLESYRIISCENVVEKYNNNKKDINYIIADILNKRIVYPLIKTEAKNAAEALQKTISDDGFVNLSTLQSYLPNAPLNEICKELCEKELIFPNFETKQSYVLKADFLKGNIKQKYENVLELSKQENLNLNLPFMLPLNRYVDILKENFPKDIYFEDIEVGFGANFIDIDIYENFIKDTFYNNPHLADVKIERVNSTYVIDNFKIKEVDYSRLAEQKDFNEMGLNLRVFSEKGIKDGYNKAFFDLRDMLERTINNKSLEVSHQEPIGDGNYKKVVETIPTKQAMDNAESIKDMFANYIFGKKEYRDRIEKQYNKIINVFSNTKLEYQKILEMPTLNKNIVLRPHQDNAVFKGICNQSMLFDHQVGAGKTFLSVALVMEQKRMGLINKALVLVPNHLCGQWSKAFMDAYPTSKLLVGDKINNKKDRKEFLYRARNGDFDAIIMKHSTFENISVMETFEKSLLEDELNKLKKSLKQNKSHKDNVIKAKMRSLETKLTKKAKGKKFDNEIAFEDLGIDCLIVDEAHEFKNLYIDTAQYRVKGIPQTDSNKAMKMYCATQYIHQNNYKLYFLTGTPVSNSIAEFYTMQRYIQPQVLKDLGLEYFDDWQKAFTRIVTSEELDSSGVNYTIVNRLSKFVNTPELMMFYKQNTDIITREDIEKISGKIVPNVKGGKAINVVVPRSDVVANFIGIEDEYGKYNEGSIIDRMNNWHKDPKRNNILVCTGEARKAALDFRLINPQAEDYAESKLNVLAQKVMEHYNDTRYKNNTQLIFCDLGVSKINSQKVNVNEIAKLEFESVDDVAERLGLEFFTETEIKKDEQGNEFEMEIDSYWVEYKKDKNDDNKFAKDENGNRIISKKYSYTDLMNEQSNFDIYSEILKKLVKLGIPQNQIAFAGDAKNDTQKATLFNKMNEGEIRILIGSTSKMGTGTNVQRKIVAMHELDCPWRPADLEQRAGRVIRQGNMFFEEDKENFEVAHYRYATEQTYDARMFQINEQKLLPLIQIKKSEILEEQRVFDSVDAEATNLAEMKAIATGNPFILEKHKIDTLLKQEERYFDYHKKNIIGSERALEKLQDDNAELQNQIQSLQECFNNQGFNQENYEIEVFGIKTTKRPKGKADEESFKKIREQVAKKLLELENYPENFIQDGKVEVLKANGISLVFRVIFESTESGNGNPIFIGSIVAPSGKSFVTGNLNFKTHRGGLLHQRNIVLDGLLERIKNAFDKIPATLQKTQERIKDNEIAIQSKKNFLSKNKDIESYERKILLNTLKQDMRNIQEIMKIRNEQRKKGIKIDMNSQEVAHLLPQYMKLLDEKGKFVGADKAQQIELLKTDYTKQKQKVESIEQKLSEHAPSERKMPESIDMNIVSVEQAQIEFQEFLAKHSTEEKVAILQNNQVHIAQAPRSRNIVGL